MVSSSTNAAVTSEGTDIRVYSNIVIRASPDPCATSIFTGLAFGLRIAHLLLDVAHRGRGALPYSRASQFEMHEPGLVPQVRLVGRQLFEQLRQLAPGHRGAGKQNRQQDGDHDRDRKAVRQPPVLQPAHERGQNEAQQPRQGQRYEQITTEIETCHEQRRDDHAGGAVDHG